MKNMLFSKKILTLTSGFVLCAILSSCGSRMNSADSTFNRDISSFSTVRDDAQEIIKKSNAAYSELKDFTAQVTILDSKTGEPNSADVGETKFFFKKLRKERVEITKSADAQKVGSVIVYLGGDKLQILLAKAIPFLGKKFTLAVNDKRVSTSRGVPFDQLDMIAMLNRLGRQGVNTVFQGEGTVNGRKTLLIEATGTFKDIDPGVVREVVQIDAETMLPIQEEVFINQNKTVLKINVNDLKLNVGLKDEVFTLPDLILSGSSKTAKTTF
jgi:outer membrane lipoprotein-sorting protein